MTSAIYLDHCATTPLDPQVFAAMQPWFLSDFGNAASRQHVFGQRAARAVDEAREQLAAAIGADPREIVWTSGATESNNLAIKGVARAAAYAKRRHIVYAATEHKAVLEPIERLGEAGFRLTRLGVDEGGHIDLGELEAALSDETLLVSIMHAGNETGVVHPIADVGRLCKAAGVLFHTDATQSLGKLPLDVEACGIDLLSASAHKLYGPKGSGVLFVRRRSPRVRCEALFDGGGHERGVRSGTLNVPGIVGFASAVERALATRSTEDQRVAALRDQLESGLSERLDGVLVNGDRAARLPGTTNLSFAGTDAESLLRRMPAVAASSSSACTSATIQPSYVLAAMGLGRKRIDGSVRFCVGRTNTSEEIERAIELIAEAVATERREGALPACDV